MALSDLVVKQAKTTGKAYTLGRRKTINRTL